MSYVVVEHQRPDPVHDVAAYRRHPTDRRHIEKRVGDAGAVLRAEWWWEPDREPCDRASRRVSP